MDEADKAETGDTREDQASYTVVLDSEPTDDVSINITAPNMVTLSPTSLTFTPSNWNVAQTVTATAVNDAIDNAGDERAGSIAHALVAGSSDYAGVAAESVAVTVNDDDGEPTLSIDSPSVAEGDSSTATMTFKVTLSPASGKPVSIAYADATTGTATSATDYAAITPGTLTFAAGQTEKTVDVTVNGDTTDEPNESVILRLSSPSNAVLTGGAQTLDGTGTITNDDDAPTVSVANATAVNEGNDTDTTVDMSFTVTLSEASSLAVTVPYTLTGTATGGSDYETPASTSLAIPAGDASGTIVIKVKGDALDEPNETIIVTLGAPTNATVSTVEGAGTGTGTITDDDGTPAVTLKLTPTTIDESGDDNASTITASLSSASSQAVTLTVAAAAVDPGTTSDFTLSGTTLTIAAGATESTGTVTVTAVDNDVDAANKTVTVSATATGGNGVANPADATLTITDDDTRGVTVTGVSLTMDEADNAGTEDTREDQDSYTVVLDSEPTDDVSINITAPAMVTLSPTSLTFTPSNWNQAQAVTATAVDDSIDNAGNERTGNIEHAVVAGSSDYTGVAAASVAVTVNDDDGTPTLTLELDPASIAESGDGNSTTVTASLSGASSQAITLTVAAAAVSPAVTGDFTLSGTTLTIAAGATESTGTVTITAVDNDVDAANKTVTVSATATGGNGVANPADATLTITDDDTRGISVSPVTLTLAEIDNPSTQNTSEHQKTYSVELDSQPTGTVTVNLSSGDTKIATLSETSLEFTASDWDAQTVTVTAVADDIDNAGDERTVRITHTVSAAGTDYKDETAAAVDVTVTDDDGEPTLSIDAPSIAEGNSATATLTFKVTLSPASGKPVSVAYADATTGTATSATDYAAITGGTLNFAAGDTEKTVDVTVNGDTTDEPPETVVLRLSSPSNAALSGGETTLDGTGTITDDDDAPTVSVANATAVNEGHDPDTTVDMSFTVTLSEASSLAVTVPYTLSGTATGGSDYETPASTSLSIPAGDASGTIVVKVKGDALDEPNETIIVTLGASTNATVSTVEGAGTGTGTITDDDGTPAVTLELSSASVTENGGSSTVTATLSSASSQAVTLTVAAAAVDPATSSDFTLGGTTLTIAAGATESTGTVTITAVDNDVDAANKTVTVSATATGGNGIANPADATLTITDDDTRGVTVTGGTLTMDEADKAGTQDTREDQDSYTVVLDSEPTDDVSINITAPAMVTLSATSLTFTPSNWNQAQTVTATAVNDSIDNAGNERTGSITHAVVEGDSDYADVAAAAVAVTVNDDDGTPTLTLELDPTSIAESGDDNATTVTASLSGASSQAVTLTVATSAVSPAAAGDSTLSGTTLTIAAGATESTGTVTITAVDNDVDAANKSVTVSATASGGGVADPSAVTLTITDDDTRGVTVTGVSLTMDEADKAGTQDTREDQDSYTVVLDSEPTDDVRINITAPAMVTLSATSLTFTPSNWNQAQTVTVTAVNDSIDNAGDARTGSIAHTMVAGESDYAGVAVTDVAVTVNDDDGTPTVTLKLSSASIAESGGSSTVTASLSGASSQAVTLTVAAAAVDPATSSDFTLGGTTLTIAAGATESTGTVSITAVDNDVDAANKTVTVSATATGGNGVANPADATLTITDDDERGISVAPVTLTLAEVDDPLTESATEHQKTYSIELDSQPTGTVTVNLSSGDTKIATLSDTSLEFTTSDWDAQTVTVTAVDDAIDNAGDARTVRITHTVSAAGTDYKDETAAAVDVTVTDDDGEPTLSIDAPSIAEGDSSTTTLTFKVTLSPASGKPVSVAYADATTGTATSATDYAAITGGTLNFAVGDTEKTVAVTVNGDTTDEPNETVVLRLSSPSNAALSGGAQTLDGTGTINDDDATPTATLVLTPATIDESGNKNESTVTATLSGESSKAVTLTVAADAVSPAVAGDFTLSTNKTLTIAAGSRASTGAVTITAVDNSVDAPNKSVTVSAAASGGGVADPVDATLTITDDDAAPTGITLAVDKSTIAENAADATVTVTASVTGGSTYSASKDLTITVGAGTSTAVSGEDYTAVENFTLTLPAGESSAKDTFDLEPLDDDVDEDTETIAVTGTDPGGVTVAGASINLTDNDTRGVTVTGVSLTMDEADKAGTQDTREDQDSYTVVLDSEPTDDVSINITAPAMVTLSATSLTFTPSNWNQAQTVTATAVDDAIDNAGNERTGNITHAVVEGDSDYAGVAAESVAVTVNDDDGTPTLTLELDPASIAESGDGNSTTVTATLSGASSQAVTLTVAAAAVSPAAAGDFTLSGTTLTIAAGTTDSTGTVTITAVDNDVDAANKTVTVSATATGGNGIANPADATLTITDDDDRGISVSPVALTLAEVDDPLTESATEHQKTYSIELDSQPTGTVTVNLSSGDTKIATLSDTSLEFTTSDWDAQTVTVTAVADTIDNAGDARTVTITHTVSAAGTDYKDEPAAAVDVTVTDDDGEPTLSIDAPSVAEGNSSTATMTFKVTLSPASGKPVSVAYADATTGTATSATDYAAIADGTLSFAAGQTEKTVAVTVNGDTVDEPNETVVLRLSSPSNAALSGGETTLDGTGTINDDDATPTATLVLTPATIDESGNKNESTVTATLSGESSEAVTLTVAADAVSPAVAGDFTLSTNKALTIVAGSKASTGAVTITAVDNTVDAANKTVTVSATANGGSVADPDDATLTITDDDERGVTVAGGSLTMDEADQAETQDTREDQGSYTVVLDSEPTDDVRIDISAPAMVTLSPTSLTFTPSNWNVAQTVTATAVDDAIDNSGDERAGSIAHTMVAGESDYGGVPVADVAVTVTDDDGEPTLSIDAPSVAEGDSSTTTLTFKVTLSPASGKPVSVTYADATTGTATSATDYAAITPGTLTFAAGQTEKTVDVTVNGDTTDEPNESVILRLSSPSNAVLTGGAQTLDGTGRITNDDDAPTVSVANATAVNEGHDTDTTADMSFTVTLSEASSLAVTVPYTLTGTATGGSDYETPSSTSLSIPAGDTSGTIVIKVKGDALDEPNETIIVTLGTPTNATVSTVEGAGTGTGTITDDDGTPSVTLKLTPATIAESGADNATTVTASLSGPSSRAVSLTVAASAVSPALAGDFTLSGTTLTIAAGATESTGTVTVTAVDNDVDAANKTVTVSATVTGGNGVAKPAAVTLTITDDDTRGISVSPVTLTLAEADNPSTQNTSEHQKTYSVELDSQPTGTVTVNLSSGNTDIATLSETSLEFTASDWDAQTVTVTAVADDIDNAGDARTVRITHTVSATGTDYEDETAAGVDVTVNDDDDAPDGITLSVNTNEVAEDAGKTSVIVTATVGGGTRYSADTTVEVTVGKATDSAVSGTDFARVSAFDLVIPAGEASVSKAFDLTPTDDAFDEAEETISVTGESGSLTVTGTSIALTDDDVPELSITAGSAVTEGTAAGFTLNADIAPAADLTVKLDVATTDSFATSGTTGSKNLTFRAGRTSETYTVATQADTTDEPDGSVTVNVKGGTDYAVDSSGDSASVDVNDDDATTVTLARAGSGGIAEAGGAVDITVTLGRTLVAGEGVTVALTVTGATETTHYTLGLNGSGGTGVSLVTTDPHSAQHPALKIEGAEARTATLTLTAVANTDNASRTVSIAYGTSPRAPSSSGLSGGITTSGSASVPILDDDAMVSVAAASAAEGSAVVFTVTLPEVAPSGGVTVGYSTSDGRGNDDDETHQVATSADYTAAAANAKLTIAQGQRSGTISISTTQDTTYEGDHYFTLTLDSTDTFNLSDTAGAAVGTITDAADRPAFAFSTASTDADEDDGTLTLTVEKTGTTLVAATVSYATTDGTAAGGSDFTAIASTDLDFAASEASKTVSVSLTDDSADEAGEAFTVDLTAGAHAQLGGTSSHTINITDNDATTVKLAAPSTAIDEAGGTKTITVELGRALTGDETLDVPLTFSGTATFGADYTLAAPNSTPTGVTYSNLASTDLAESPPTIAFSGVSGAASSATVILTATSDTTDEGATESVTAGLGTLNASSGENLDGGASGSGTATFNITDDDGTPTATLALTPTSIDEAGDDNATTVTATLSGPSSEAVTLTVAAAAVSPADSGDFTLTGATLTIAAGTTTSTGTVTVTAVDNEVDAPDRSVTISATASGGGVADPSAVTLTITDDDTRGVTVTGVSLTMDEADKAGTGDTREDQDSYTVVLDSEPTDDVRINITAPAMVTLSPTSLTFTPANWNVAQTVTATAVDDSIDNAGNERAGSIAHAVVEGDSDYAGVAAESVAVTVNDDDGTPTLTLELDPASIAESGDGNSTTVTATLSGASSQDITLTVAAAAVSPAVTGDFTLSGTTLTIAAGATESTGTVTITAVNNDVDAANKTVTVSATATGGNGVANPADATLTITDDDTRGIGVSPVTLTLAEIDNPSTQNTSEHQETYTVDLDSQPTGTVTVNLSSGDTKIATLSETSLEFTTSDWDAQTVTVTAVADDIDNAGDERTVRITHTVSAAGTDYKDETAAAVDVTVTDDDGEPTLSIDAPSIAEGNSATATLTFKVTLSPASGKPVTVAYADATTGTATSATDYAAITGGTLNFAVGDTEKTVDVTVNGDTTDEPPETVVLRLSSPNNARLTGGSTNLDGTGTITDDDDAPTVSVANATAVNEGNDPDTTVDMSFTVTLSEASSLAVTVPYTLTGTATGGSDYETPASTSLSFAAGDTSGTIVVKVKGDALDEPNETIIVTLGAPTNATVSTVEGAGTGTGTITDDDGTPAVTLELSSASVTENGGSSTVAATLSSASSQAVTLTVAAAAVDPATSSDFTLGGTTLTIAAGATESTGTVTITAVDNDVDAANKTVTVSATATGGNGVANPADATLTVTDDDTRGVTVTGGTLTMDEADKAGTQDTREDQDSYTVVLDSEPTDDVSINITAPAMVTLSPTSLTFTPSNWNQAQAVTATAVDDSIDNAGNERTGNIEHAVVAGSSDYTGVAAESVAVTVNDDDGTPTLTLELDPASIAESGDDNSTTVTASLSGASSQAVTLTVAAAAVSPATSSDFTLSGTTLTIAAGATESTGTVTITAVDNYVDAANKTVTVSATASGGGVADPSAVTLTITDDDTRGISVSPVTLTLAEVDNPSTQSISEHQKTYTVELDSQPTGTVTVNLSSGDTTIATLSDNSLEFTASDWDAQTVTVTAVADDIDNAGDERTVRITHTVSATGTDYEDETAAAVDVTVTDDDGEPTLSIDAPSVDEGNSGTATLTFKVTLSPASGKPVSVAYADATTGTATSATDYTAIASGTLSFAAGQTEKTVDVTVNGDTVDELNETVVLRLSSPSNAALTGGAETLDGTGRITDDDDAPTVSVANATAVNEGNDPDTTVDMSFTVTLSEASSLAVTVPYTLTGTATGGSDYETPASTSLSFAAGDTSGTIVIKVKGDALDEPNETIIVTLGAPTNATVSTVEGAGTGTGTITDDDGTPAVTLKLTPTTIDESGDDNSTTVAASLSSASSQDVTLTVAAAAVDPGTTSDFTLSGTTLTIAAGATESTGTVTITAANNDVDAANKTVTVSATATGGNGVANPADATLTITDDDTRGVTVTGVSLTMDEADKAGTGDTREDQDSYTVVLDSEPTDDVRIDITAPAMVTLSATSLTFTPSNWNQAQTVTVTAVNDSIDNAGDARTGSIAHTMVAGESDYAGVAVTDVAVTVNDDDGTPTVTLKLSSASIAESGGSSTVTASLSGASSQAVTLTVAAAAVDPATSSDFTLGGTTLTIAAGATESTGTVSITAVDNDVDATNKTVTVSATATGGGVSDPSAVTLTITDDDTRGISVSPVTLTLAEVDDPLTESATEHRKTYSVELDSQPTGTVTVNLSSGDTTIVTLSDNSLEFTTSDWDAQTVTVTAVADATDNAGDERTVRITHTVSAAGTDYKDETAAAVDVTVTDDDGEPTLSIDAPSVAEGDSSTATMTFKVTLSPASGKPVSVAYADAATGTATSATDYAAITGGTLNFAAGDTEKTVDVTVNGDTTDEPNETVILRLSSPSNAALSGGETTLDGTGTITDDDGTPTATLVLDPTSIDESGDDNASTVTATLSGPSSQAVTLTVAAAAVDPATSSDFTVGGTTLTIAAGATTSTGTVTITAVDNTVDAPDKTVTVSATASGGGVADPDDQTLTILDDDEADKELNITVSLGEGNASTKVAENVQTAPTITVTASLAGEVTSSTARTVNVTVGDDDDSATEVDDYEAVDGFDITIAAEATSGTGSFTFTPVDDAIDEDDETVSISGAFAGSDPVRLASITITDDDTRGISVSPVTLTLAEVDDPLTESATEHQKTYSVELDSEPTGTVTVNLSSGDTTIATLSDNSLEFTASDWDAQTVTVTAVADNIDNAGDARTVTITHTVSATATDYEDETAAAVDVTVTDDDGEPTLSIDAPSVDEGDSATADLTFKVTLSPASGKPVSVAYADARTGTATSATDYAAITGGTLSFAVGQTEKTVTVTVNGDTTDEPHETVILRLSSPNNAQLTGGSTNLDGTGTITDDDDAPTVSVADATAVNEGNDPDTTVDMSFTVSLSEASSLAVTVPYTLTGTATGGSDYETPSSTSLSIPAGDTSGTIVVKVKGDALDEPNETIIVTLGAPTNATVSTTAGAGTGTGTINDDDGTPSVTLKLSSASITENGGSSTVTASLSGATHQAVTLTVAAAAVDPATSGDFTLGGTTLTIAAGATESTGTVTITAVDNDVDAANKTVTVSAAATGGGVSAPSAVTLTITDDDTRGVTVAGGALTMDEADNAGTEGAREDQGSYTVVLDSEPTDDVRIDISAPAMVTLSPTSLTFTPANWNVAQTVTATAVNDSIDNAGNERTGSITHAVVEGDSDYAGVAAASVAVTVNDDDGTPSVTLELSSASITENGGSSTVTASLSGASSQAVTLTVAAAAVSPAATGDFTVTANKTLTIAAGATESTGTVTITAVDNDVDAANKTVTVSATASGGGVSDPSAVTLTITDDDDEPTLSIDSPSVAEGDSSTATMTFKVTLSPASGKPVSVAYADATTGTATSATDYAAISPSTLNFAAGQTEKTVDVTVNGDTTDEPTETVVLRLSSPNNARLSGGSTTLDGTGTINDDDDAPTVSVANATAVNEGHDPDTTVDMSFTVTLSEASSLAVTVPYTLTGTATGGSDYETPASTSLSFAAGDTSGTIVVKVKGDALDEPNETIIVTLGAPTNATVSTVEGAGTGTGTITDDDGTPAVTLKLSPTTIAESGDDNASTITASLSSASSQDVTLTVAAAAVDPGTTSDFTLSGTTLTIAAGATESTGTVTITAANNDVDAGNKTVTVSATATGGNGVANPADATLTITDDDTRGVTVTGVSLTMDEADQAGTADTREDQDSYTVVLDSKPTDDVRIDITAPAMVTLSPTSLTFTPANWNVAQTVTATAVNDAIDNAGNERTGSIAHAVVEGDSDYAGVAAESVAVTVNDDDGTPTLTLELDPTSIAESGDGNSTTVTASLSGASSQAVTLTVAVSAVSPAAAGDFTLSGTTLTIAAGATESTGTVTITAVDNDVDAANKTVTVSAAATGGGVSAPSAVTLMITDDDTRGVTVAGGA